MPTTSYDTYVDGTYSFSMWPLLKKDGLAIQYIAATLLWNVVIGHNPFRKPARRSYVRYLSLVSSSSSFQMCVYEFINCDISSQFVYGIIAILHIFELILSPPMRYPDLYVVLNVLVCAPIFGVTWIWSIKRSTEVTWGVSGVGLRPSPGPSRQVSGIQSDAMVGTPGKGAKNKQL